MTQKTLENWVKEVNPKAKISQNQMGANTYAVTIGLHDVITDYMPLPKLEMYLRGVFNSELFIKRLNNK